MFKKYLANKTEDDEYFERHQRGMIDNCLSATTRNQHHEFSNDNLSSSLRPSSSNFEDDHDSEMASTDGVSESENNHDNSMNNLQSTTSSNFARSFLNNTRRRMSSGLVLSYNFLKGSSGKRRDST